MDVCSACVEFPTQSLTSAPAPQQREGQFSSLQLVAMQRGVAAAMQYLSSFAFVHRALSARSVLVNSHLVCKVARLGHSPQVRTQTWGLRILQRVLEGELEPGAGASGGIA